ncbi:MAG: aldolase/citrate lyase family protein, partial [Pseudomonadota bacterium]
MTATGEASSAASFRERLGSGQPLIGTWVKTPSSVVCEVLCGTRLDVLALDAEHAPFGRLELDQCLAVAKLAGMPALVRVPSTNGPDILNALDCGATGVIAPHVTSAEAAEVLVKACHFGPGGRGYAGSTRAAGLGRKKMPAHLDDSRQQTTIVAQIEDVPAVAAIDDI